MAQFKTLQFPNTADGQAQKIRALENETANGWRIVSETIIPGKFDGQKACCFYLICAPCAFLAGHKEDTIQVTLERSDSAPTLGAGQNPATPSPAYDKAKWDALVQYDQDIEAAANTIQPLGQRWVDELAAAYLTIGDKAYLLNIVDKIQARAAAEEVLKAQAAEAAKAAMAAPPAPLPQPIVSAPSSEPFLGKGGLKPFLIFVLIVAALFTLFAAVTSKSPDKAPAQPTVLDTPSASAPAPVQSQPLAEGPSFRCNGVTSDVLKLVCSNSQLAALDRDIAGAYKEALEVAPDGPLLREDQRAWIRDRNNSTAQVELIAEIYRQRIAALRQIVKDATDNTAGNQGNFATPDARAVTEFFGDLERGDGASAAQYVIPEKRTSGPLSADALSTYFSRLPQPLKLQDVQDAGENWVKARYTFHSLSDKDCVGVSIAIMQSGLIERLLTKETCQ